MQTPLDWQSYQTPDNAFSNKIILVTGAADGIGRAITIALAQHGATVLMLDKKVRHLEKLSDQIVAKENPTPVILPVDLMDINPTTATELAQAVYDDFGKLDGICLLYTSPSPRDRG